MIFEYDLSRFIDAQKRAYERALGEIRGGYKASHWMWYIFPQLQGLGRAPSSSTLISAPTCARYLRLCSSWTAQTP